MLAAVVVSSVLALVCVAVCVVMRCKAMSKSGEAKNTYVTDTNGQEREEQVQVEKVYRGDSLDSLVKTGLEMESLRGSADMLTSRM